MKVRVRTPMRMPPQKEVDEHNVTHIPYRAWCPICMQTKAKSDPHKKKDPSSVMPIINMDYSSQHMKQEFSGESTSNIVDKHQ